MKLMKYTFDTPLFGSIECEELLSDTDGRIDLSPQQMCRLYDRDSELAEFLESCVEDLAFCVPEQFKDTVLRAEFGDFDLHGGMMWLQTHIWVTAHLTQSGIEEIQEWISGQMSDGWGEGVEQCEWMTTTVSKPTVYFDEWTLDFEESEELCEVSYCAHPWNADEFYISLVDVEEVEVETQFDIIASMNLPRHNRKVLKCANGLPLRLLLKQYGQPGMFDNIQDSCVTEEALVYLVQDMDAEELLPNWVIESGEFCCLYDVDDKKQIGGDPMPLTAAIAELLK